MLFEVYFVFEDKQYSDVANLVFDNFLVGQLKVLIWLSEMI